MPCKLLYLHQEKAINILICDLVMRAFFYRDELEVCHSELCHLLQHIHGVTDQFLQLQVKMYRMTLLCLKLAALLAVIILSHKASVFNCCQGSNGTDQESGDRCSSKLTLPTTFPNSCCFTDAWLKIVYLLLEQTL